LSYALVATANFERGMKRLSFTDFNRSKQALEEIANSPYSFKELKGKFRNLRSARFGKHRIIYAIIESKKEVILLVVEPRRSVYER
jgi:mRNA-degrading endonuclease RelE of RelBE toxin-antitoxin system